MKSREVMDYLLKLKDDDKICSYCEEENPRKLVYNAELKARVCSRCQKELRKQKCKQ